MTAFEAEDIDRPWSDWIGCSGTTTRSNGGVLRPLLYLAIAAFVGITLFVRRDVASW